MALEVAWAYGSAIWPGIKGLGLILTPSFCPLSVFLATFCAVCLDGSVLEGRAEPFPRVVVAVPGVWGCDAAGGEAPPPSSPFQHRALGRGTSGVFCWPGRFTHLWTSSGVTQERSWVSAAEQGQNSQLSSPSEWLRHLKGQFDFLILALLLLLYFLISLFSNVL